MVTTIELRLQTMSLDPTNGESKVTITPVKGAYDLAFDEELLKSSSPPSANSKLTPTTIKGSYDITFNEELLKPSSFNDRPVTLYETPSANSSRTLIDLPVDLRPTTSDIDLPMDLKPILSITSATTQPLPSSDANTTDECCSSTTTVDAKAADKAAAKAAKRRARRDLNRTKRKAEAAAREAQSHTPPQPWEVALGTHGLGASSPSLPPAPSFVVPSHHSRRGVVPKSCYDLTHPLAIAAVQRLISAHGGWSITFADPSYRIYLSPSLDAAISYKVVRGFGRRVAVAFGDPVCPPSRLASAIAEFEAFCKRERWGVAFVAARSGVAGVAEGRGWASVEFAVEQVVDPQSNPVLEGRRGRRQSLVVKKLAKDHPVRFYIPALGRDPKLEEQLQAAYDSVYSAKEGGPYSTKLSLFALPHLVTYLYITDASGLPTALAGLLHTGGGYLLDPLVATASAPAGATDYLTILAMGYLRRLGASHLSFGTEPTPTVGEIRGMRGFMEADTRLVHAATYRAFGMGGKKMLHDKFHPDPRTVEKLYLVLGAGSVVGQSCCAAAIWRATHLKCAPVVEPLLRVMGERRAGVQLERMLRRLAAQGRLTPSADLAGVSSDWEAELKDWSSSEDSNASSSSETSCAAVLSH